MKIVSVIAAGAMGANVGRKFVEAGITVLTNLEGRSDATRRRAEAAGLVDAPWLDIIEKSDIVLSIIPPRDAVSLAQRLYEESQRVDRSGKDPLIFADCNAVNVKTVKGIAAIFEGSAIRFIDGCIIGGPPSGSFVPIFYLSAHPENSDGLEVLEDALRQSGIRVGRLDGGSSGIGDASALKMSYAGISKGLTGLCAAMLLAAHASSPATAEALLQELGDSQPELLKRINRHIPMMLPKAYRWVGEMEEIAGFVGEGEEAQIYQGLAKLYERIERSLNGEDEILQQYAR